MPSIHPIHKFIVRTTLAVTQDDEVGSPREVHKLLPRNPDIFEKPLVRDKGIGVCNREIIGIEESDVRIFLLQDRESVQDRIRKEIAMLYRGYNRNCILHAH